MHYIGVDYHKKYSYVVVKNREGKVEQRGTVNNTKEEFRQALKPYQTGKAVLEATRNWGLIYDWLEEILGDVALAHPLKVRAIAEARIKTDKISADILCDLLRSNLLPEAYVPNKETRESENTLRQRMFFVRVQTMVKELAKGDKKVKLLRSIPGLGPFFSVLVAKEIDDISRFRDEKKLCTYAGLVPSTYASGGKVFHGRITKMGNKWLRWAFIEAVQPAVSCDADLFAYYQRLKMKKGANAAKVATARRLLTIVYRVLKQERLYERRNRRAIRSLAPAALVTS